MPNTVIGVIMLVFTVHVLPNIGDTVTYSHYA
jgi:hypothetical protein